MKFLFVAEYFPPFVMGGAEISLKILVDELVKNGHEVVVLTPNYSSFKTEIGKKDNLRIIRFKSFRSFLFKKREKTSHEIYKKTKPIFYLLLEQYLKYSSYELKKNIKKILEKEEFDVIHANNLESILALNNIKTSAKKIAHLRDFSLFCYNRGLNNKGNLCCGCSENNLKSCMDAKGFVNRLLLIEMRKRVNNLHGLSSFNLLIAISKFVRQQYVNILGADENRIEVLYNPISNDIISNLSKEEARKLLNLPEDKKIVLFVGSLTEKKGAHLIPKIAEKLKDYLFIVIGDGVLKGLFLKNKWNNIIYLGHLPISELRHYYRASDILLVPSLWYEPFGRVVLEGAYNGCYVIGSNRGGIPEVIDWLKCGVYIEPTVENFVMEIKKFNESKLKELKLEKYNYYNEFMKLLKQV
ncbi:glycosyltransferase [Methanocaldococcus fervens]|uniref:Glycosyl transferase group 1 n=1 Tax=Methanocaldococcus fervens (strain DSM 4213 / JCM 15782 / AG86) TaxID=573064 RepID=C7P705_METFA|nr:glycosyltransferase [Methanocaldococcus fervens]ACV24337.1 glycosyl transferase group 1 [Methanocaldococcus fervens AG86]